MRRAVPYTLILIALGVAVQGHQQGTVTVEVPKCTEEGQVPAWSTTSGRFQCTTNGNGGMVPSGAILIIKSGTCPTGYTEDTDLNGRTVLGTLAANGDIGTVGGSDTITEILQHAHPVTDPQHVHVQGVNSVATGGLSGYTADTSTNTRVNSGYSTSMSPTGITVNNPVGSVASIDNRSAFRRVLFCKRD